jgi:L-threonylcarbamoyladenylate synthase
MSEVAAAARALSDGFLVAFPTETVYGLGADATNAAAVARIYEVKGRPVDHPLIVHLSSSQGMSQWAQEIPSYAQALAQAFWPGPMTLVLKRSDLAGDFITGGQDTVGVRVPGHPVALELLAAYEKLGGKGVAAPSANRFGKVSPTTAKAVRDELSQYWGQHDVILEGGPSEVGIESTIIDCTGKAPSILRPGAITPEMITRVTGLELGAGSSEVRVSGSLESHYSPRARVVLGEIPNPGDGFIALAGHPTPEGVIRLAAPETPEDYARVLYSALRDADEQRLDRVVAIPPVGDDIALAIRDRLERASN